ncbi:MAG: tetratricopeptide repeat protein, partial [Anaerolineales bacterium]|nr:tetratricopeptide repeat protein [Anaerolineales bacterium]
RAPIGDQEGSEITFDLLFARSNLAWMKGDVAQQEADILALVEQVKTLLDPRRKAEAYIQQASFLCSTKDEYEKAHQAAEIALKLAEEHNLARLAASAWQQIGVACLRSDQYSPAKQALNKSIALWQSIPEEDIALAEAMIYLAQVHERTGDIAQAKAQAQKVVDLAEQHQSPLTLARAWALLGTLTYRQNDFSAAIQYNQQALEQARKIGHKHNEAVMLCNLGFDYWALGDYATTISFTRQGFEIYRQLGNQRGIVLCCDNLSALYNEMGQYSQAQQFITDGLKAARQIGFPHEEGQLLANLGRLHLEQSDCGQEHRLQSAIQAYQQSLEVGQNIDSPYVSAGAYLGLGMVLNAQKTYAKAGEQFALALENYEKAGESAFATGARSYLAINRLSTGEIQAALELSAQAVADLEAAGGGEYVQDTYLHHFLILTAAGQVEMAYQALEKAYQAVQARAVTLPPEWRDSFLNKVSINRRILRTWESNRPNIVQVRLPRLEAPTGRPLQEDEWIEVNWTVSTAADQEIEDKRDRRRTRIMRLLDEARAQGAAPTIDHLASALDSGPATIKRDLADLRQAGHRVATRGERERPQ